MKTVAMLLMPNMTQLDLTGPYDVFARCPDTQVHLVWKNLEPVRTEFGLSLLPTATFAALTKADILVIPGGGGVNPLLTDSEVLQWIRGVAEGAGYVTSVCTGALLLGAAGLLQGKKATTHWTALEMLPLLGAIPIKDRVVMDGNIITGGGITAGIDFALYVAAEIYGEDIAQSIQLTIEYNPQPPFNAGHPDTAPAGLVAACLERIAERQEARLGQIKRAAGLWMEN